MSEFGFKPDLVVQLEENGERILVSLAKGGEEFPWAVHDSQVLIGPLEGGPPNLKWNINKYWVMEALDSNGVSRDLTPAQFLRVVSSAESV